VQSAFFEPAGISTFVATPATAGPWSPDAQHGGPPSALVARALERHEPVEGQRLGRVTVDILRPVPVAKLTARTRMVRPGRRVALLEAVLEADGQELLHARGWRIAVPDGQVPVIPGDAAPPPVPEADGPQLPPRLPNAHTAGYLSAIEWRFLEGSFEQAAPGRAWTRPRIPLVVGEDASPMCRALLVADSGSGVGAVLDPVRFIFINVDLTVVLPRDPVGEWLLLEAATTTSTQGTGMAETALSDVSGRCGTALQTLLVAPR
jgi:Thioesterase-like superfamily